MRSLALFLLTVSLSLPADFRTGQAARLVIGQRTFTAQDPTTSQQVVGAASGLAYANDMLIVADSNRVGAAPINNRVLIYRNLSTTLPAPTASLEYTQRCPVCVGSATVVLGQTDFTKSDVGLSGTGLRLPTAVATDGTMLAVADTDNNRVLIWRSIPAANGAPADLVLGQPNLTANAAPRPPNASSLRGPQGVWFQNGKLFVADTQNHRVLIWNSIPSSNGQPADVVLGQPNFTTFVEVDLTKADLNVKPETLLNPVSVTSDGVRLYVTDLGHNRVLIWNSIPTSNQAPADLAIGQPDMTSAVANNVKPLCTPNGKDANGNDTYPPLCAGTLSFPRYALSDGQRLFIADGGNDRVLVYNSVPIRNGQGADTVLGQFTAEYNSSSDSADPLRRSSSDSVRTPMSLAWDGKNLFVTDPFNRRIMVFTLAEPVIPYAGVRNAAGLKIFAVGGITFSGTLQENDEITITIKDKEYKYKLIKDDSFANIVNRLVDAINASGGDPNVFATPNTEFRAIILSARGEGSAGNEVSYSVKLSDNAKITATAAGAQLAGGQDAAKIAPGTLVSILGESLAAEAVGAPGDANPLPLKLGGVEVYFDGIRSPLLYVSPTQVNAQIPWEVLDTTSLNAYVRTVWPDGHVTATNPVAVPVIKQNPAIFTYGGETDPRPGVVQHFSSNATGTVSVDGSVKAGDIATVIIEDREYSYTVVATDTLTTIRDALIVKINADPKVEAFASGVFTRIRLRARVPGNGGNGIKYSVRVTSNSSVILSPTGDALCCANIGGSLVTDANPALPGETIIVFATGLGLVKPDDARLALHTGAKYAGPVINEPEEFVSSLAGGKTANVLFAGVSEGMVGVYEIHLELNSDIPTNPETQLTIAQFTYVSNIITFQVFNPKTAQ
jgi:uncharacterized protein (TIGR03437 family)